MSRFVINLFCITIKWNYLVFFFLEAGEPVARDWELLARNNCLWYLRPTKLKVPKLSLVSGIGAIPSSLIVPVPTT